MCIYLYYTTQLQHLTLLGKSLFCVMVNYISNTRIIPYTQLSIH